MLVLTRLLGESLFIGGNIEVTVLSINGMQVRLGISAPPEIAIVREELLNESDHAIHTDPKSLAR